MISSQPTVTGLLRQDHVGTRKLTSEPCNSVLPTIHSEVIPFLNQRTHIDRVQIERRYRKTNGQLACPIVVG